MHKQKPTITQGGVLAVLALPLLALALTGCGIGRAGDKEKISKTATTYLRALAAGDTAKACAQLTRHARGERCETATKRRLARLEPDALKDAADGSLDIDVHGKTATAGLPEPAGARFVLAKVAGEWRIDSGYTLGSATSATVPATPVGRQLTWALAQLNGGAARLTQTGERGSLRIKLDRGKPTRILGFEIDEAPPTIAASGPYSGRFDIGRRKLFLNCSGSGSPTVVFQGGLTTDWVEVQNQVARFTRAC